MPTRRGPRQRRCSPDLTDFWWNPKRPDQAGLWESKVRLSESFFNEIVSHPVPLDLTTLKALKRSPWASISTYGSPIESLL